MAELAGGIIGIITVGTKLSLALFSVASQLGSASEDVRWLGTEISVFCSVLGDLRTTLNKARATGLSLDSLTSMSAILDHCKNILLKIEAVIEKLTDPKRDEQPVITAVGRAKWLFSKKRIDELRTRLESAKLTLTVMMTGFDWALLLEQKERSTVAERDTEQQANIYQSLLRAQQFLVQRLETLEIAQSTQIDGGNNPEEDFVMASDRFSHILNGAVFEDGLNATDRQWASRPILSPQQSSTMLNQYAATLTTPPDPPEVFPLQQTVSPKVPSRVSAIVLFKPIPQRHHHHFKEEPQTERLCFIQIEPSDTKSTIKLKAILAMDGKYDESHYDLHLGNQHLDEFSYSRHWPYLEQGLEPALSIQNTLWERCREDTSDDLWTLINIWKNKIVLKLV